MVRNKNYKYIKPDYVSIIYRFEFESLIRMKLELHAVH